MIPTTVPWPRRQGQPIPPPPRRERRTTVPTPKRQKTAHRPFDQQSPVTNSSSDPQHYQHGVQGFTSMPMYPAQQMPGIHNTGAAHMSSIIGSTQSMTTFQPYMQQELSSALPQRVPGSANQPPFAYEMAQTMQPNQHQTAYMQHGTAYGLPQGSSYGIGQFPFWHSPAQAMQPHRNQTAYEHNGMASGLSQGPIYGMSQFQFSHGSNQAMQPHTQTSCGQNGSAMQQPYLGMPSQTRAMNAMDSSMQFNHPQNAYGQGMLGSQQLFGATSQFSSLDHTIQPQTNVPSARQGYVPDLLHMAPSATTKFSSLADMPQSTQTQDLALQQQHLNTMSQQPSIAAISQSTEPNSTQLSGGLEDPFPGSQQSGSAEQNQSSLSDSMSQPAQEQPAALSQAELDALKQFDFASFVMQSLQCEISQNQSSHLPGLQAQASDSGESFISSQDAVVPAMQIQPNQTSAMPVQPLVDDKISPSAQVPSTYGTAKMMQPPTAQASSELQCISIQPQAAVTTQSQTSIRHNSLEAEQQRGKPTALQQASLEALQYSSGKKTRSGSNSAPRPPVESYELVPDIDYPTRNALCPNDSLPLRIAFDTPKHRTGEGNDETKKDEAMKRAYQLRVQHTAPCVRPLECEAANPRHARRHKLLATHNRLLWNQELAALYEDEIEDLWRQVSALSDEFCRRGISYPDKLLETLQVVNLRGLVAEKEKFEQEDAAAVAAGAGGGKDKLPLCPSEFAREFRVWKNMTEAHEGVLGMLREAKKVALDTLRVGRP